MYAHPSVFFLNRLGSKFFWPPLIYTHTDTFSGLFSRTSWVSRHQKVNHSSFYWSKRWWGGSGISWAIMQIICTTLQTDNHASTPSLNFLRAGCSSWRPTNSVKALRARTTPRMTTPRICVWMPDDLASTENVDQLVDWFHVWIKLCCVHYWLQFPVSEALKMDREPLAGRPMFVSPCNRQAHLAAASKLKVLLHKTGGLVVVILPSSLIVFCTCTCVCFCNSLSCNCIMTVQQ